MSKKTPASIYTALRIPPKLRKQAQDEAMRSGRTLSNYIRFLIQRDLSEAGMIAEDEPDYVVKKRGPKKKR